MKIIPLIPLICIVLILSSLSTPLAAQQPGTLELVIALDTSGSMSQRIASSNSNERNAIDAGNNLLYFGNGGNRVIVTEATDPDNLTFSTIETLIPWVAAYAAQNDNLEINATVLKFDTRADSLMPMTVLGRSEAQDGIQLDRPSGAARHSDFIELYREVEEIFSQGDEDARGALFIITDSPPCNPLGPPQTASGVAVRNEFCDNEALQLAPHLAQSARLPNRVQEYVFFINPYGRNGGSDKLSADTYWETYDSVRSVWDERVGSFFFDLDVVEELPQLMQRAVMREMGIASNHIMPETVTGINLSSEQYRSMGLLYSREGLFQIPPYQSAIDFLLLLDGDVQTQFTAADDTVSVDYRASSSQEPLRYAHIQHPPSGDLQVTAGGASVETWGILTSATPRITLVPSNPHQYQPQQILYQLFDGNEVLDVSEEDKPSFSLSISPPTESEIPLGALNINSEHNGFISSQFLPTESGTYEINLTVNRGQGDVWPVNMSYDYLDVDEPDRDLVVEPVVFNIAYEVDDEEASNPVEMPRSLPLTLTLTTSVSNNSIAIPEGITADVVFTSSPGQPDACLPVSRDAMLFSPTRSDATYTIDFDEQGLCNLDIDLQIANPLPPLGRESRAIEVPNLGRRVDVDNTTLLSVVVMTDDEEDITQNAPGAVDFGLDFPQTLDGNSSTALLVEIRDEENTPVWPVFERGATRANADYCEPTTPIVPFELAINDASDVNVAESLRICLQPTDVTGRYRAVINGLGLGTYTVAVTIDRDEPRLDVTTFEYDPEQFPADRTEIVGTLAVTIPPTLIIAGVAIAGGIIALVALILLWVNLNRKRLRGTVAFYAIPQERYHEQDDESVMQDIVKPLWQKQWPKSMGHQFRGREFLQTDYLKELQIQHLTGTTGG